jgi:hypothetical protein
MRANPFPAVGMALTACLAAAALAAPAGAALPDGRAYERVSPADTDGTPALQLEGGVVHALNDNEVIWGFGATPATDTTNGANGTYLARRTPTGWSSQSLLPANAEFDRAYVLYDATPDLSASVWYIRDAVSVGSPPPQNAHPQRYDYRDAGGTFTTIVTDDGSFTTNYAGITEDGQTVVYSSPVTPAGLSDAGGVLKVYRWRHGGPVERIADGAGDPLAACAVDYAGGPSVAGSSMTNNVSADGTTVFLQTGPGCPTTFSQLYVNTGGVTTLVSGPTDGTANPVGGARSVVFRGGAADGQSAYFRTISKLSSTDNDTFADLYRWTAPQGATPAAVTCISCAPAVGRRVGEVLVSPTGSHVYFVATGIIAGSGQAGVKSLFVYTAGGSVRRVMAGNPALMNLVTTATTRDGAAIVFTIGTTLYQGVVSNADVTTACVSCDSDGNPASGAVSIQGAALNNGFGFTNPRGFAGLGGYGGLVMTDDGATVVFGSSDVLTDDATPGVPHVYQWSSGGGPSLIAEDTRGGSGQISPSGASLFFVSADRLTADTVQDTTTLYAARVGGGFPLPPPPLSPCQGDACQGVAGSGNSPPTSPTAPTAGVAGSGNAPPSSASDAPSDDAGGIVRSFSLGAISDSARRQFAQTGRLRLAITSTGGGRIDVLATATLGGHGRAVGEAERTIRGTTTTTAHVTVRLADAARRELAKQGRLTVRIAVTVQGVARTERVTVELRRVNQAARRKG